MARFRAVSPAPAAALGAAIPARLRRVAEEFAPVGEVPEDADLARELGLDSLGLVELLAAVEDEFGVVFDREELPALETLRDVVRAIECKLAAAGGD